LQYLINKLYEKFNYKSTEHRAQSTEHRAQSTEHRAQSNFLKNFALLIILFSSFIVKAQQPFGVATITNCYQRVDGSLTGEITYNMINSDRTLFFSSNNPLDIVDFDVTYPVINPVTGLEELVFVSTVNMNNSFYFPTDKNEYVIIPNNNGGTFGNSAQKVRLKFVEPKVTFKGPNGNCILFNSPTYDIDWNIHGLCDDVIDYEITYIGPVNVGLPPGWKHDATTNEKPPFNVPMTDYCNQTSCGLPNGWIAGCCLNFNIKATIEPCYPNPNNCPNLTINSPLKICCSCGSYNPEQD